MSTRESWSSLSYVTLLCIENDLSIEGWLASRPTKMGGNLAKTDSSTAPKVSALQTFHCTLKCQRCSQKNYILEQVKRAWHTIVPWNTVFPRNLATVRFNLKAPYHAVTIWGWLDFEGSDYRDWHVRTYTASINYIKTYLYACIMRMRICRSLATPYHAARFWGRRLLEWASWNMRRDFEGGGISKCSEILRNYGMCNTIKMA